MPELCLSRAQALAFVVGLLLWQSVSACIFKYGTAPDSLEAPKGGTPWNHGFHGDDWSGVDAAGKPWICLSGIRQSPIIVPSSESLENSGQRIPARFRTTWNYPALVSNGSNIEVINTGHTIQVEWLFPYNPDVFITVPANPSSSTPITAVLTMKSTDAKSTVRATPLQFHFHTTSEHALSGKYYPLELHIVHRVSDLPFCAATGGCFTVTGILFELVEGPDNPLLASIWGAMPTREGAVNTLPSGASIQLNSLLPPTDARDYVTYEGSLTTPPCSEGLLWHVFLKPQTISRAQWTQYKRAVGFKECTFTANGTAVGGHHRHSHRHLMASQLGGNPNEYVCKISAYGTNFRSTQGINGRVVKLAPQPSLLDSILGL